MFYELRRIAEEEGTYFRAFLDENLSTAQLRGVHLNVDRYWVNYAMHWRFGPHWEPHLGQNLYFGDILFDEKFLREWRPPEWATHCSNRGFPSNASPIQWQVIFRSPAMQRESERLPRSFEGKTGQMPIRYEARPPAVALVGPGDSVGQMKPATDGTLGGLLEDPRTFEPYLVTCAHVCSANQAVYSPGAPSGGVSNVANVVHAVLPPQNFSNGCNRCSHSPPPALDLAIARITQGQVVNYTIPKIGQPQAVTSIRTMTSNDPVSLYGQKSGLVNAELDSVCLYHEIDIAKVPHCFGDIFSLTPPHPWYVNTDLVKPGDSGAWITRKIGSLISWDGLLVAGDGAHGYACFAENIMAECKNVLPHLVLP